MPDVSRSDSQRSDSSQKPRVSFNRDVHVKRIGREGVVSALAGDGEGHLVPLPVRRERPGRLSRRELEKEAQSILRQAESVHCTPTSGPPDKFSTLPPRPRAKRSGPPPASSIFNSLERRKKKPPPFKENEKSNLKRRNSNPDPLLRTSSSSPDRTRDSSPDVRQRKKLERSVSDAGKRGEKKERSSIFATLERIRHKKGKEKKPYVILETDEEKVIPPSRKKKQLSPIIEIPPFKFDQEVRSVTPTVVYAEVIAKPGHGKTTVHTSVLQEPPARQQGSEDDEGVEMGRHENFERKFFDNDSRRHKPKEYTIDIKREPQKIENDFPEDRIINMLRSQSSPLIDDDYVTTSHRHQEYKTERVIRIEGAEEPDGRGRADGMDYSGKRRDSSQKEYDEGYRHLESFDKVRSFDELDRIRKPEPVWNQSIETSLFDTSDLSLRRDRLESRIGVQRRRYLSGAKDKQDYRDDRVKTNEARKEFMMSQIDDDKDRYFETRIASEIDNHRQKFVKSKDLFADSGIEMNDYRKDSDVKREIATLNRRNVEIKTKSVKSKSTPILNKSDYESETERPERKHKHKPDYESETERPERKHKHKSDYESETERPERKHKHKSNYESEPERTDRRHKEYTTTRVHDQKRDDVIPTSTVLVKNYAKPLKEEENQVKNAKKPEVTQGKEKKKEKLSKMDKVKQLMFGSKDGKKKKKKKQAEEEEEDPLTSRYTEYRGSDISVTPPPVNKRKQQTSSSDVEDRTDQELEYYGSRQRLATPSPKPSEHKNKQEDTWFKSLTRRNKHKIEKKPKSTIMENGEDSPKPYEPSNKTLRFFGDTDQESLNSQRLEVPNQKHHSLRNISPNQRHHSKHDISLNQKHHSTRDVSPNPVHAQRHHSSRDASPNLVHSPRHHLTHDVHNQRHHSTRDISPSPHLLQVPIHRPLKKRHSLHESSADSTTEGDSSQHSQKSVVYLHAATVGDIPGSRKVHRSVLSGGRRAQSREELSSNNEITAPHSRTLSRSISVLAPWRPRHNRNEINYDDVGKPPKPPKITPKLSDIKENKKPERKEKRSSSKSSRHELRKSKENLINKDYLDGSNDRQSRSRDNLIFVGKREDRENSYRKENRHRIENGSSTVGRKVQTNLFRSNMKSTENLDRSSEKTGRDLSRSMTIPKDTRLTSGWFKNKPSKVK